MKFSEDFDKKGLMPILARVKVFKNKTSPHHKLAENVG
jgi:hypothetical protein